MTRRYKFFLVRYKNRKKNLVVSAPDNVRAREMIEEQYPGWQVSMYWVIWPY